jgi:hypothetical protein
MNIGAVMISERGFSKLRSFCYITKLLWKAAV